MHSNDWVLFSVDPVIFTVKNGSLKILLSKRENEPFKGSWGLPGGRVDKEACIDLKAALHLKLKQKTGLDNMFFEQLGTYGNESMDPRGWSVTTAYLALVHHEDIHLNNNAKELAQWHDVESIGKSVELGFWHEQIIKDAVQRLRDKSLYTDLPVNFMPVEFTYAMLREAYEAVLGFQVVRQAFTARMERSGIFEDTGKRLLGSNRPSPLYRKKNHSGAYIFAGQIKEATK
jgi:8-oxo-dGTP diphosphatase